jgi:signal transduction histidine kinase
MKKQSSVFYYIGIFVISQAAWFSLLGLWIYWYVSNYIIFEKVEDKLSPQMVPDTTNVVALVSGLILLVVISIAMSLIFAYLNRQMNLNKLYNNFIANVTHELKSPLSSIQLYLETIRDREVPREKQGRFISLMLKDAVRLDNLINSILYISGLETKKNARKYPHDYHVYRAENILNELIDESAAQFQVSSSINVLGSADCRCVIDKRWMRIVFDNLIDNAVKYSQQKAKIEINFSCSNRYLIIEFNDQGIGINSKDQKRIFNKFERIDDPESPNVKGTGLGLYWVREIVKYHGGKISVSSAGKNKGTAFKIQLPIYKTSKKRYIRNLLKISGYNRHAEGAEDA